MIKQKTTMERSMAFDVVCRQRLSVGFCESVPPEGDLGGEPLRQKLASSSIVWEYRPRSCVLFGSTLKKPRHGFAFAE